MTIICALHDPERKETWIGSNQGSAVGDTPLPSVERKWLLHNGWALGMAGDGRPFNLLEAEGEDLFTDLEEVFELTQRVQKLFDEAGIKDPEKAAVPSYGQSLILANEEAVWDLDSCLAVSRIEGGRLWARGSGMDFALGADHALSDLALAPDRRVRKAVEAAIANDFYCPGTLYLERLGG